MDRELITNEPVCVRIEGAAKFSGSRVVKLVWQSND